MTCKAVIFDLYGTLVDFLTRQEYAQCHLDVASALGIPADEIRAVWNDSIGRRYAGEFPRYEECLEHVCRSVGKEAIPEQIEEATRIRLDMVRRNLRPRDGVVETLSSLRSAGLRLGLISDCVPEVPRVWPETEFDGLIDAAIFSPEVGITKPDSRIYTLACERLSVAPAECLYVGDGGSHELTGARDAGMRPVLIKADPEGVHIPKRPDADGWDGLVITDLRHVAELAGLQS